MKSFGTFIKEMGWVPPDMMGKEFDEETQIKEEQEARKNPLDDKVDHKEDHLVFEIALINKSNHALNIDCLVKNGQILFEKVRVYPENGLQESQRSWMGDEKSRKRYQGPKFANLSEPLQDNIVQYLYEAGVHPEIAICLEYLSWNKEQRYYMNWLNNMFFYFYGINERLEEQKQGKLEERTDSD